MLKIEHLSKDFDGFPVLIDLNWTIPDQKIVGLIGANGSGKSTLLRCLSGVYVPSQGILRYDDKPLSESRERLMSIPDEPFYVSRFSTREMTLFYKSFYKTFSDESYQKLLAAFHFDENKPIHQLSKGLKRQSAIILGLSCMPKLITMDESFDGLDPRMRLTLKRELIRRVSEEGCSIIISSHNIRELEDICDEMALLENHSIAFTKTLEELNSNYHKVQLGYEESPDPSLFKELNLPKLEITNRIATVIYKGDETMEKIQETKPLLINPLPLSMEEIFVAEMEENHE